MEVDLCLGTDWALEIKASPRVADRHLKGLKALREEGLFANYGVISLEKDKRETDGITIWPWREFLEFLWNGGTGLKRAQIHRNTGTMVKKWSPEFDGQLSGYLSYKL